MKTTSRFLAVFLMIFLLSVGLALDTSIHATITDNPCTFDFEKTTVADALQQIMRVTGVKIHINKPFDKAIVGRSYLDADLEHILRDLFWQENVAIEWRYGKTGLETVVITLYEKQKDQRSIAMSGAPANYSTGSPVSGKSISYEPNVSRTLPVDSSNPVSVSENTMSQQGNEQISGLREGDRTSPAIIYRERPMDAGNYRTQTSTSQMSSVGKDQNLTPVSESSKASAPIPAPPVKHGLDPPPMPPGFLVR